MADDDQFIPMTPGKEGNTPKQGRFKKLGSERPQLSQEQKDSITNDWVNNVSNTLGTYDSEGHDVSKQPYHIYVKDGVKRFIRPGPDDFSYYIADPTTDWKFVARDFPQADSARKAYDFVRSNPFNPWDPKKGWGKEASAMTMGEINDIQSQLQAWNLPKLSPANITALTTGNAMLKDMETARDIMGQMGDFDADAFKQSIIKGMNWTGKSPDELSKLFNTLTFNQLNKVIDPKQVHLYNRLYVTLQHLANEGADISGLPQGEKGNQTNLPEHFGNLLSEYGLLEAGKAAAGGAGAAAPTILGASLALKSAGAFLNAVTGGQIDVNHLKESLKPALNEARQLLYANTNNLIESGYRVSDTLRQNAERAASAAQDEGVGPYENPYSVSTNVVGTEEYSPEATGGVEPKNQNVKPGEPLFKNKPSQPGATPAPSPSAAPLFKNKPTVVPSPSPAPIQRASKIMYQPGEESVAPRQAANQGNIPHLTEQDDVDGLESGSPFMWQDHPDPYVKV